MEIIKNEKIELVLDEIGATIKSLKFNDVLVMTKGYTVGRYANRIKGGTFYLNGIKYNLSKNEGENTLHGGLNGFMKRVWTIEEKTTSSITYFYLSKDGEEGFPGNLKVYVTFELIGSKLVISYKALSDFDTIINLTNHGYFNLNGEGSIYEHNIKVLADKYLEVDKELIPTNICDVMGTKFDLREEKKLDNIYDHNFVLNGVGLRKVAYLKGLTSGMEMNIYTDQVGMQIYNTESEICFETQHYPDSPNHMDYPSTTLKKGEIFNSVTIYEFYM